MLLMLVCSPLTAKPNRKVWRSLTRYDASPWMPLSTLSRVTSEATSLNSRSPMTSGNEMDLGVTRIGRDLRVAVGAVSLPRRDIGDVGVVFVLIERCRIGVRRAEIAERHLAGVVRDLERAVGRRRDQGKARRIRRAVSRHNRRTCLAASRRGWR